MRIEFIVSAIFVVLSFQATFTFAVVAQENTIDVGEHGVVPGADATQPLKKLIASIAGKPNVTLTFPKSRYDFYPDNAVEIYRAIANHDNGNKRIGFPLFDFEEITIAVTALSLCSAVVWSHSRLIAQLEQLSKIFLSIGSVPFTLN